MKDFLAQARTAAGRGVQIPDDAGGFWHLADVEGHYAVWENRDLPIVIKTCPSKSGGLTYVIRDPKASHNLGGGWLPLELPGAPDGDFAAYLEAMETVVQIVTDRYSGAVADGAAGPEFTPQPDLEPEPVKTLADAITAKNEADVLKLAAGKRLKADQILDIHALAKELRSNKLMNVVRSLRVESAAGLSTELVRRLLESGLDWVPRAKFYRGQLVKPTAGRFLGDIGRVKAVFANVREATVEFQHGYALVKYAFDDLTPLPANLALRVESLELIGESLGGPVELKPFTKEDWMSYGGAEAPEAGEGPLIGYNIRVGDDTGDIIVDETGVQIHLFSEDGDMRGTWHLDVPFKSARHVANALCFHRDLTAAELTDHGFERLD